MTPDEKVAVRMNLAAASAELLRHLSSATMHAIGTLAISSPRKNIRKSPALTIMNIPRRVEMVSM